MKISVWQNFGDYSMSCDFEFDASDEDEVRETEKYAELMGIIKNEKTIMGYVNESIGANELNISHSKE